MLLCICEPEGIQTLDLQNRNLTLYSAKLRVPWFVSGCKSTYFFRTVQIFSDIFAANAGIIRTFAPRKVCTARL